jgi:hypothetical protein
MRKVHPAHATPRHPTGLRIPRALAEALDLDSKELERVFGSELAASLPHYPLWSSLADAADQP